MSKHTVSDFNLVDEMQLFNQGEHYSSYKFLGNKQVGNNIRFSVWAPNAKKVALIGDFNGWQETLMTPVYETGLWTHLDKNAVENQHYKYRIYDQNDNYVDKIDPYAQAFETPPLDAAIIKEFRDYKWEDQSWMRSRKRLNHFKKPLNIYEVHSTSWMRHKDNQSFDFYDLANTLIPYVKSMNYTHIELMPVMDHPLEASWGYQITGYFAVAGRFGTLEGFAHFVNEAHKAGIGVIIDWVPSHFCINANALAYYDGTPTFEYNAPWQAKNLRWGTLNFDLGKAQVRSFLYSNAMYWINEFHVDGIRIDAVSNMLYRDYDDGYWEPNEDGSNNNREGVKFLQDLNLLIDENHSDVIMMAEESTSWANVCGDVKSGSLGFDYKWNMGWMNDTLNYFKQDSWQRNNNFKLINFNFVYMHDENFILPLSHDEVVHGKNSLLGRLDGSRQQQFQQLRLLQTYMFTMPGKKLNFMGNEIGQFLEWRFYDQIEWPVLGLEFNQEYQDYIKQLNKLYKEHNALFYYDHESQGIEVLKGDPPVLVLLRKGKAKRDFLICVHNFTHDEITDFEIEVPHRGSYEVILNSGLKEYGGYWEIPHDLLRSEVSKNNAEAIQVIVPAMSSLIIKPKRLLKQRGE